MPTQPGMISKSRIAIGLFALASLLPAAPARALLCGDGVLDTLLLEQCDDGNNLPGDCCSPLCQFESSATVCRASTGACDPAETCTGESDVCPADVTRPDGDGDQVCDEDDLCPLVADPAQADVDVDGIGDACDACINPAGTELVGTRLSLTKLTAPGGDDRMRLRVSAMLPRGPALNPIATGLTLLISDAIDTIAVAATIPGGDFDRATRTGWQVNAGGNVFNFRSQSDDPALAGVRRITLKADASRSRVRLVVLGRDSIYGRPSATPIRVTANFNPTVPGQCAETDFPVFTGPPPRCMYLNSGARLTCR